MLSGKGGQTAAPYPGCLLKLQTESVDGRLQGVRLLVDEIAKSVSVFSQAPRGLPGAGVESSAKKFELQT